MDWLGLQTERSVYLEKLFSVSELQQTNLCNEFIQCNTNFVMFSLITKKQTQFQLNVNLCAHKPNANTVAEFDSKKNHLCPVFISSLQKSHVVPVTRMLSFIKLFWNCTRSLSRILNVATMCHGFRITSFVSYYVKHIACMICKLVVH